MFRRCSTFSVSKKYPVKTISALLLDGHQAAFKAFFGGLGITALLFACFLAGCRDNPDKLVWTSIDLNTPFRQGDAHLLTVNKTSHVLIDTGSRETADMLVKFLRNQNCADIKFVIITHGHNDHYGGLVPLINSGINIGRVYFNPPASDLITNEPWGCSPDEIAEIHAELAKKNIPLAAMDTNSQWSLGKDISLRVTCVFDGINTPVGRTDINDTSAVIMLTHRKIRILFAADLNRMIGDYLTRQYPDRLRADVLKFPHHGAESFPNNDFFAAVGAKAVVVPTPKELWLSDRCARARDLTGNCPVYVNGVEGNIKIVSDGSSFQISSERSH